MYHSYTFSSNQNQLKDISDVYYFKLPYISNLSHHIKNRLSKLQFCKENVNIKLVFTSFQIENYFSYKEPVPGDFKFFLAYNFFVLAVVLAILSKFVVILKLGLRNISKRISSLMFLDTYTPPQQALTRLVLFFKIVDKANPKLKKLYILIRENQDMLY